MYAMILALYYVLLGRGVIYRASIEVDETALHIRPLSSKLLVAESHICGN